MASDESPTKPSKKSKIYVKRELARERERRAWQLRTTKFFSHRQIAEALGVTRGAVTKMLLRVERRYLERQSKRVELIKAEQDAQLDALAAAVCAAWEQSMTPSKKVRKRVDAAGGAETTTEVAVRDGNPQFASLLLEILAERRRVWGIDKPTTGDNIVEINIERFKARLIENQQARRDGAGGGPGDAVP
jgi:DNA-binding transcriptional MocR family regulator